MITDIRKLKKGVLLVVEAEEVVAYHDHKKNYLKEPYKIHKGEVIFLLDLLTHQYVGNCDVYLADVYFIVMHNSNCITLRVKSIKHKNDFPKSLQNNLYATYNFSIKSD